jgi:hypothetical protein
MPAKPENPAPGEDVFTDEDLQPDSEDERRAKTASRRGAFDTAATIVAVLAFGMIAGGMIALGAVAAPVVFKLPDPLSGNTMGATFSRFDGVAITCSLIGLAAELVRTLVSFKSRQQSWLPRVRRYLAILLALGTLYVGMQLSPKIMSAYEAGVRRNVGAAGAELEATHKRAELVGKVVVALSAALIALHIVTLKSARQQAEDDEDVLGPLPPGPASG